MNPNTVRNRQRQIKLLESKTNKPTTLKGNMLEIAGLRLPTMLVGTFDYCDGIFRFGRNVYTTREISLDGIMAIVIENTGALFYHAVNKGNRVLYYVVFARESLLNYCV